jgi:hypothetical protein
MQSEILVVRSDRRFPIYRRLPSGESRYLLFAVIGACLRLASIVSGENGVLPYHRIWCRNLIQRPGGTGASHFLIGEKSRSSSLNTSRSVGWNERPDRGSATAARLSAPAPYRMPTILKCRLRLHFWTAETCLRFGFTVKSKRMVKSFAMVFERRSQSVVVP